MPLRKTRHPVGACTAEQKKEFAGMNPTDHAGVRLTHGKPKVNGVEIHYTIGGAGEPVFLLHGVPKTMSYWRHVVPLLTPHYTVIAVDNRGAGGSQRPMDGYDTATMAGDVAELEPFHCPELQLIAKHNLVSHQPYYRRACPYVWQKGNG